MENEYLYSNGDACKELAKLLKTNIKGKISFSWNGYESIMRGSYNCIPDNHNNGYLNNAKEIVKFYYKFNKNIFLRIGVGDNTFSTKSIGYKLAALSDFYIVLFKIFGEPTVFYTTKNNGDNCLNFRWSFNKYKDEDIKMFKNGTFFVDDEIKDLIVISESQELTDGYQLNDTTKRLISKQLGLPFELLELVNENIDEFIKYKEINLNSLSDEQQVTINESKEKKLVLK